MVMRVGLFIALIIGLSLAASSTTHAANECGAAVAGGTVTCNGSGTPAANLSPYAAGITYTVPITMNFDGSVTPLTITGAVSQNTANTVTPSIINTNGTVIMNRTGALGVTNFGNYTLARVRPLTINLGAGFQYNGTRTSAGGQYYAIGVGGTNTALAINNQGTITTRHTAGGVVYQGGLIVRDNAGGANSRVAITNSGTVSLTDVSANGGSNSWAIYAGSTGAGSPLPVTITHSGSVVMDHQNQGDHYGIGIQAVNSGSGGTLVTQNGSIELKGSWGVVNGNDSTWGAAIYQESPTSTSTLRATAPMVVHGDWRAHGVLIFAALADIDIDENISISASSPLSSAVNTYDTDGSLIFDQSTRYAVHLAAGRIVTSNQKAFSLISVNGGTFVADAGSRIESTTLAIEGGPSIDDVTSQADIVGNISTASGNDSVKLLGGSLSGTITLGDGDDTLELRAPFNPNGITTIDGGSGTNNLVIDGAVLAAFSAMGSGIKITNFASIVIENSANLELSGDLVTTPGGIVTITSGSRIGIGNQSGIFTIDGTIIHDGIISLQQTTGFVGGDELRITHDYQAGGVLQMDAYLNTGIPNQSDRLIIDGDAAVDTDSTTIALRISGSGGLTAGKGILIVQITGDSPDDAFVLDGEHVDAGGYRYRLVKDADDGNWYLRSEQLPVVPSNPSGQPGAVGAPSTGEVRASIPAVLVVAVAFLMVIIPLISVQLRHRV